MLLPHQQTKLARGTKDKEHAMTQKLKTAIVVIGIEPYLCAISEQSNQHQSRLMSALVQKLTNAGAAGLSALVRFCCKSDLKVLANTDSVF